MMSDVSTKSLIDAIVTILTEAYAGPPDPSSTWFIDNEPNSGILGILDRVPAKEASQTVHARGEAGSTIAANAEHLRWSLAQANAALRGEGYQGNWKESWNLIEAEPEKWDELRRELRSEFETLRQLLQRQTTELSGDYLLGVLALLPHAAYHLGTIRQMVERVSENQKR